MSDNKASNDMSDTPLQHSAATHCNAQYVTCETIAQYVTCETIRAGKASNVALQRIYGISFPEKKKLKEHLLWLEEAKRCDFNYRVLMRVVLGLGCPCCCLLSSTHCNTLQHTATPCSTLQHTASHCNTLQHTATHCNTLQHTVVASDARPHSSPILLLAQFLINF